MKTTRRWRGVILFLLAIMLAYGYATLAQHGRRGAQRTMLTAAASLWSHERMSHIPAMSRPARHALHPLATSDTLKKRHSETPDEPEKQKPRKQAPPHLTPRRARDVPLLPEERQCPSACQLTSTSTSTMKTAPHDGPSRSLPVIPSQVAVVAPTHTSPAQPLPHGSIVITSLAQGIPNVSTVSAQRVFVDIQGAEHEGGIPRRVDNRAQGDRLKSQYIVLDRRWWLQIRPSA